VFKKVFWKVLFNFIGPDQMIVTSLGNQMLLFLYRLFPFLRTACTLLGSLCLIEIQLHNRLFSNQATIVFMWSYLF